MYNQNLVLVLDFFSLNSRVRMCPSLRLDYKQELNSLWKVWFLVPKMLLHLGLYRTQHLDIRTEADFFLAGALEWVGVQASSLTMIIKNDLTM